MDELQKILNRLPVISGIRRDAGDLKELLYERRPPRLVAVGDELDAIETLYESFFDASAEEAEPRAGSAVAAAGVRPWKRRRTGGGDVLWLALDSGDPDAAHTFRDALDRMVADVILVVTSAHASDEALAALAESVATCWRALERGERRPEVLPIVLRGVPGVGGTEREDRFEGADDLNAERARHALESALERAGVPTVEPRALSLAEDAESGGLESLASALVRLLPASSRVAACRLMPRAKRARREVASAVVQSSSALAITVAVTPIPISDLAVIGPLQIAMVSSLAYIGGRDWDRKTVVEWLSSVGVVGGVGFGLRWGAQQLVKLVPGAGSLISAGIAGSGTAALGQAAMAYFLSDREGT